MILVTAGILRDGERILICQRKAGDRFALKWEFPEVGPEVHRTDHCYPNGVAVRLLFFRILRYAGTPVNRDFEQIVWARPEELAGYDFLEADREIVNRLIRGEVG
jgi:hypothetical protein